MSVEDVQYFQHCADCQINMLKALNRFEAFLGLNGYEYKQTRWAADGDHNLLRITRVIRSLRLFGLESDAKNFYDKVMEVAEKFELSSITVDFWKRAMNDELLKSMTDKFLEMKRIDL